MAKVSKREIINLSGKQSKVVFNEKNEKDSAADHHHHHHHHHHSDNNDDDDDDDDHLLKQNDISSSDEESYSMSKSQYKMIYGPINYDPTFSYLPFQGSTTGLPNLKSIDRNEFEITLLDFFNLYFDEDMLEYICGETNKYATLLGAVNWTPVTPAELRVFSALKIHQGIVQMPREYMHWSKDPLFEIPLYRSVMPFSRYIKIRRYLHFTDNEPSEERLTRENLQENDLSLVKQDVDILSMEKKKEQKFEIKEELERNTKVIDDHLVKVETANNWPEKNTFPKRSTKKSRKIFYNLLDMALWNSYLLYKASGKSELSPLQYRVKIIREMIEKYRPKLPATKAGRPSSFRHLTRYSPGHFPIELPPSEKKKAPTRRCIVCAQKRDQDGKRVRKETRYKCEQCNESLCVTPCFKKYHTQ